MKILKLLNNKKILFIFVILLGLNSQAEEQPVDIWNASTEDEVKDSTLNTSTVINNGAKDNTSSSSIYEMQSQNTNEIIILDQEKKKKSEKIIGLYDPEDYGLNINMWSQSNGDQLKKTFSKLMKIDLSEDANEIMNISMLINAYPPQKNISKQEFLKFKSDWLIKNSNLDLIEEYLIKNQMINLSPELARYYANEYLSVAKIKKACDLFFKNSEPINDEYLSKFYIYCLVNSGKKDEAQLILDLKKELGFKNKYFEK